MTSSAASSARWTDVSTFRLYALRVVYLLNFVMLGADVWPQVVHPAKPMAPVTGAAFAFWAALSALSGLGLRYPLKMLPLIFMQLFHKTVWLLAVAIPLRSSGQWDAGATDLFQACAIGAAIDLLVIPWPYVLAAFVKTPGDRWAGIARAGTERYSHIGNP